MLQIDGVQIRTFVSKAFHQIVLSFHMKFEKVGPIIIHITSANSPAILMLRRSETRMQAQAIGFSRLADKAPPHLWFGVSAVFHYLGPAFAVLLFPSVGVLGVAWLRIATAARSSRR